MVRITIFATSFLGPFPFSSSREMRKSVNRASTDVERPNLYSESRLMSFYYYDHKPSWFCFLVQIRFSFDNSTVNSGLAISFRFYRTVLIGKMECTEEITKLLTSQPVTYGLDAMRRKCRPLRF